MKQIISKIAGWIIQKRIEKDARDSEIRVLARLNGLT